jgi:DNA-binding LacI/PurR family transcriptional regulator
MTPRDEEAPVPSTLRRPPAMTDVARLAGVSHQTVSRVLNSHPSVKQQTRMRVLAAMNDLGYRPNRAARALATGRSQVLGVVAQNSTLYGPASLLAAFEQEAAEAGLAVAVASVRELDRISITQAVERHLDQRVAGIVVIAPVDTASAAIDEVKTDVPLVSIDGDPASHTGLVTVDQAAGARLATQFLLDAGHATVWHVSGPANWFDSRGRIEGWRQTLLAARADVPPLLPADWSPASGYAAGQMLARMPDVTAIFAANDHLALGIMKAMRERGRRIPQDVSLVGFDDIPEAGYFVPPLTTIRPNFEEVARASLDLLLQQIRTGERSQDVRTIAPALVQRASVGPPPV